MYIFPRIYIHLLYGTVYIAILVQIIQKPEGRSATSAYASIDSQDLHIKMLVGLYSYSSKILKFSLKYIRTSLRYNATLPLSTE